MDKSGGCHRISFLLLPLLFLLVNLAAPHFLAIASAAEQVDDAVGLSPPFYESGDFKANQVDEPKPEEGNDGPGPSGQWRKKRAAKRDPNGFQQFLNANPKLKSFLKGLVAGGDKHLSSAFQKIADGLPKGASPKPMKSTTPSSASSSTSSSTSSSSPSASSSGKPSQSKEAKMKEFMSNVFSNPEFSKFVQEETKSQQ